MAEQTIAGLVHPQPRSQAFEQRNTKRVLEVRNPPADRGLVDAKPSGRAAEAAAAGDVEELLQIIPIERVEVLHGPSNSKSCATRGIGEADCRRLQAGLQDCLFPPQTEAN